MDLAKELLKMQQYDIGTLYRDWLLMFVKELSMPQDTDPWEELRPHWQKVYSLEERINMGQLMKSYIPHAMEQISASGWYDGLGLAYEEITSQRKSSALGQFFTPVEVCNLIAGINLLNAKRGQTVYDPACGSSRLALAANALQQGMYYRLADIDSIACYMTLINCVLHNMCAVVLHMNTITNQVFAAWTVNINGPGIAHMPIEEARRLVYLQNAAPEPEEPAPAPPAPQPEEPAPAPPAPQPEEPAPAPPAPRPEEPAPALPAPEPEESAPAPPAPEPVKPAPRRPPQQLKLF